MKTLKKLLTGIALAGAVTLGGCGDDKSNYLTSEDFEKSQWIEYHNPNGRIWSCYTNESIPHNQDNWHLYIDKVTDRNNKKLSGYILLPDLDGNGRVGK